jgi:hypothetical protein
MKDSNKLIAEFMGFTLVDGSKGNCFLAPKGWDILMMDDGNGNSDFNYHKSWDWLMQVVERIENFGFEFYIVESRCKVAHNTDNSIDVILASEGKSTKLDHTYSVVVEFINQYNKGL